ncbi:MULTISPECIES: pyridoxamine 5'-phosphate oxidase family protein [Gordonia]|uniref:pyridoxamine 5'-phosphate oxidase family protein n=1 Tax=Gordonia TaxID=2053 RepID=UPI0005EE47E5|nr:MULTISPECIES: pyridoxamine 5'-phosphate oxidase family protein [Gordonia]KJR06202.1 pyridoxamine 5'-phosphate oxidase [Gordonia sihwensis]KXT57356.1 pyridoxamine 5'-phosphate oxidase [Gordonia sp. QH-12]WFN93976.1 pyridoxamine 5'-phosphate oxidase family protein [Gordonia sihwensis]
MSTQPVENLSNEQSWELLEGSVLGRLAVCVDGQPDVFPVNIYVSNGKILFRTAEGTKLAELAVNDRAVIEVDAFTSRIGWSVVAKGRARILRDSAEIEAADQTPLNPWIPTVRTTYVEIAVEEITGRRFVFGPEPDHEIR